MYGPGAVGRGEWYVYDVEMGFPGLTIDGTACVGGGDEPPSLSESYEDMVAGGSGRRNAIGNLIKACFSVSEPTRLVPKRGRGT